MRIRRDDELRLSGGDARSLVAYAHRPFDLDRAPTSIAGGPGQTAAGALGHLVRRNLDPLGWVRDAALELVITEIVVRGDADVLDAVALVLPPDPVGGPFTWAVTITPTPGEDGLPPPPVGWLDHVAGPELAELLERDATHDGILALHTVRIARSIAGLVTSILPDGARVEVGLVLSVFGFTYDRGLPGREHARSELEAPRRDSDRRSFGRACT